MQMDWIIHKDSWADYLIASTMRRYVGCMQEMATLMQCFSPSISCVNLLPPCLLVSPALEGSAFDCYTSCGRLHFHSISAHWNLSSSVGNFRGSVHEVARWCSWFHPRQRQGKQCCLFLWTKSVLWVPPSFPPHSIATSLPIVLSRVLRPGYNLAMDFLSARR